MATIMSNAREVLARAMDHHRYGRVEEAEAGYREILQNDPNNADALHLLGAIIAQRGHVAEGIDLISRALAQNPNSKEAHLNLANILSGVLRMVEAERHFRKAYTLDRTNADAAGGLGGALMHMSRYAEAEPYLREALSAAPRSAAALLNMGMLTEATGRFDDAMRYYEQVLALDPTNAAARAFRAFTLLLRGRFVEGWPEYAWRLKHQPTFFGRFPFPFWRGEPLAGRKILVWTEMGPGDEILAATMIPDLVASDAIVILLCSPRMAPLFARSFPSVRVIAAGQAASDPSITSGIAFQASVGELGTALRRTFSDFRHERALLKADPARTADLRRRYQATAPGTQLIGISWRSKNARLEDAKTIPLELWGQVLQTPGATFVSLQYGDSRAEIARAQHELGVRIIVDDQIDPLTDLDAFSAQVAAMDMVVSVSNTTVHVAGALGIPVWALVPSNHGRLWYWFLERSDSPWYPSVHLFRQDQTAGWQPTVATVAEKLTEFTGSASARDKTHIPAI